MSSNRDLAKVLAICIAHIDRKVADIQESVGKNSVVHEKIIVESAPVETVREEFTLPTEIVYESHLDEAVTKTLKRVDLVREQVYESLSELESHVEASKEYLTESIQKIASELDAHNHDENYSPAVHDHGQYLEEEVFNEHLSDIENAFKEAEDKLQGLNSETKTLFEGVKEEFVSMSSHIDEVGVELRSITEEVREASAKLVEVLREEVDQQIVDLGHVFKSSQDAITEELRLGLRTVSETSQERLEQGLRDVNARIERVTSHLNAHSHPEYAFAGHDHNDLAPKIMVDEVKGQIRELVLNDVHVKASISALEAELSKKPHVADVWLKAETDGLVGDLVEKVASRITMPKDGKDAHEWEFKFHPTIRGILMYRRSDQLEWKRYNLIPTMPQQLGGGNSFGGFGGGGGDAADLIIKENDALVDGNVKEINFSGDVDVVKLANGVVEVKITPAEESDGEPTGFPNRTDSAISFNDATRTFTIAPVAGSFDIFLKSRKLTISDPLSIQIPDVEGIHYFYFDSTTKQLTTTHTFSSDIFRIHGVTALLYWQPAAAKAIYFADERHGIVMDGATHAHFHLSIGAQYRFGLNISGLVVDGTGSTDSEVKFGITNGRIADEDLEIDIINGQPQQLSSVLRAPVFYRLGGDTSWFSKPADDFPFLQAGSIPQATGTRPSGNVKVGSVWQVSQIGDNKFGLVHILATNDVRTPVIAISGGIYDNKTAARAGAETELLSIEGIPFAEFVPVATIILNAKDAFLNSVNAAYVSTASGNAFIDWTVSSRLSSNDSQSGGGSVEVEVPYVQNLSGTSFSIGAGLHGKRQYAIIRVYDASRRQVFPDVYQSVGGDIFITSTVDLTNHYVVVSNP